MTTALDVASAARDIRLAAGLDQEQAAERLGLWPDDLAAIERGYACPAPAVLARYRDAFGIDPHVLAWCRGDVPACVAAEAAAIAGRLGRVVQATTEATR